MRQSILSKKARVAKMTEEEYLLHLKATLKTEGAIIQHLGISYQMLSNYLQQYGIQRVSVYRKKEAVK